MRMRDGKGKGYERRGWSQGGVSRSGVGVTRAVLRHARCDLSANCFPKYPLRVHIRLWYSMRVIKLRLSDMLEKRGVTAFCLQAENGIRYASIWQMANGDTARLH